MDKLQACKETKELWTEIARFASLKSTPVLCIDVEFSVSSLQKWLRKQ